MLRIHNSLSGEKEILRPIEPGHVGMYVCGITVYDYLHLGHARFMVVFDTAVRHLRASGYRVTYVRNITDIDDKIIRRAREEGVEYDALTARFIDAMHEDTDALGLIRPDVEPRATERIGEITAMIERLIERGHAYGAENGDVYYDVSTFPSYGKLSGKRLEDLRAGARVEVDEAKSDPLDFVLWKAAKPGEPAWPSPWGEGRPGWHIECSAMSTYCLGDHFDIHGGGLDLKFPHHENEIAQSEGATGERFVNLWMHNGFVQVDDEKMSKSLGNFRTVRDVLAHYRAEDVRYFILGTHYRSPLAYAEAPMLAARQSLQRLYTVLRDVPPAGEPPAEEPFSGRFAAAIDDDFNTPLALRVLLDLSREIYRLRDAGEPGAGTHAALLHALGGRLGLLQKEPDEFLKAAQGEAGESLDAGRIEALIEQRRAARAGKDFATADRIRDQLSAHGIQLEDRADQTLWRRG